MTEKFNEFVSAMLDDEADEFESGRVTTSSRVSSNGKGFQIWKN